RRFFGIFSGIVGAVLLALVLYIAFGDLSRHKGRIEAFVTQSLGRPFAIDGPFKLKVLPVIDVSAERVRLGNAQGGSQPQMLEIGKVATQIGLWSLISGPPDVRSFELRDMTVLLELAPDGKSNWIMGTPTADDEAEEEADEGAVEVPVVIRSAQLSNVRLIYREASKADRALQLDTLSITPGREELLAMDGQGKLEGKLDTFPLSLKGEMGPLKSLLSARDMRMAMQVSLGKLALDVNGVIGRLDPLDGADLTLKVEQPELGAVLEALDLPVIATGPIRIDTRLKDAGALTQLDFNTKVGDLEASVNGTLKTLSLVGSDLKFEATAADAARLASVFEVSGVPAAPLTITGHTVHSGKEITFEALTAAIADASVRVNGSMRLTRDRRTALRFELAAPSLARLRETWPELKVSASGAFESAKDRIEVKDLQAALGENQLAGSLLLTGGGKHIEAQLSSPRIDLTPFFPQEKPADTTTAGTAPPPAKTAPPETEPSKKFMFSETPLSLDKTRDTDVKAHLVFGELVLGERSIKDLDSNLRVDHGQITFDMRAAGAHEGTLQGAGTLIAAGDGTAKLEMKVDISKLRTNLGSEGIAPADVPPLSLAIDIRTHGSSPRQMASGANGQLLLTQGAGKTRSGLLAAYGGGVVGQLAQKLNPFAKDDPFMKLDCTVARADIVNGKVTVKPVLLQSEKVTITADGTIDLHTEQLLLDFNTR
ncbi:MAG TPA: AsmA family protein, partial [Povalibacter sp.]